jgi:hypothetical protein
VRPQSGSPMQNRPQSGGPPSSRPASAPPSHPVSGQARAAYPQVPRPVSGGQARGAASVPSAPQQPYRHPSTPPNQHQPLQQQPFQHQPMQGGRPENSGGRQVLIVLAVVLALLVLVCAGVISFLYNHGNNGALPPAPGVVRTGVVGEGSPSASYRLMKQVGGLRYLNHASEGRQTL